MASPSPITAIISAEQRFLSCPACHTTISLADVEQLEGAKILCTHCGTRVVLRIGNQPKKPRTESE
jgi:DNA-directed RNA polymerase subunit RPC12/RpoP